MRSLNERHHDELVSLAKQVCRILRENPDLNLHRAVTSKLPGDTRSLRGIPVQARGVGGTSPGTDPAREVGRREHVKPPRRLVDSPRVIVAE